AFITGCTTETKDNVHYVNLSQVACSFLGERNSPLAVDVKASPAQWTATPGATWVKIERTDERTLTITVDDNGTGAERNTTITIEAGQASQQIRVNQLPLDSEFARYRRLETFQMGAVMSPSGRYMGGFTASIAPDDSWQYSPTIVDTETDEVYEFGPFPESLYYLTQTMAITDQGLLFISDGFHGGQIAIDLTGNIFIPEAPAGFTNKPQIQGTSADGKYWVGFGMKGKLFEDPAPQKALLWIDGVPHELPMLDLNYRDEEIWVGVMARGISADGSIIYGTSWESSDFGMLYWVNNGENTAKPRWVGEDVREVTEITMQMGDGTEYKTHKVYGCICTAELTKISPNGKWIASSSRTETPADDRISIVTTQKAAFFNTETETTVIVE
ncbi:BACON domain-containing protein, partial [Alistipes putredinis]|uniref:BACON domain-containing protein n=1 Tax=Alistipes putredinis TaxID=28117 RepID=UPI003A944468